MGCGVSLNAKRAPRLLVVATHPIQYQAPLFRALAVSGMLDVTVAFLDLPDSKRQGAGFGVQFAWDVPLTDGYPWVQIEAAVGAGASASSFFGRRLRRPVRALRALAPDAVMVMGWNQIGLLQAWVAAKLLGLPLIVRGDSNAMRRRPAWKRWVHRLLLAVPDGYIAVGESNARFYAESRVPVEKVSYAPHFVDNRYFAEQASLVDRERQRAGWGISPADCCVLFAGKLEAVKRVDVLVAALANMPSNLRDCVVLLVAGTGPLEDSLRTQAQELGVRAAWAGFLNQSRMPAAYAVADMLVLPSAHETWGLVVNEAMACGVPAIVSDQVGCANDLVRHGVNGLVFPNGNAAALGEAISALAMDPDRRRAMGEAARQTVTGEYTIQRSVEAIIKAVDTLIGPPSARAGDEAARR